MTDIIPSLLSAVGDVAKNIQQWTGLTTANPQGAAISLAEFADRSVQVEGTFAAATVVMEGTIDGTNYRTLKDHLGNNLSFTTADIRSIDQIVTLVRPHLTGGDGTTLINVSIFMRTLA